MKKRQMRKILLQVKFSDNNLQCFHKAKEEATMLEQVIKMFDQYKDVFHKQIPRYRQNRYIQIVVLRETKSHAIFTTEGQTLDVERLQAGITRPEQIDRVVMYKRKQIAPERR